MVQDVNLAQTRSIQTHLAAAPSPTTNQSTENSRNSEFLTQFAENSNVPTPLTSISDHIRAQAQEAKCNTVSLTSHNKNLGNTFSGASNRSDEMEIDYDESNRQKISRYFPPTTLARRGSKPLENTRERQAQENEVPLSLTLLDNTKLTFKPGTTIRNGIPCNGQPDENNPTILEKYTNDKILPTQWSIKDGAFSLGTNRFRVPGRVNITKTQAILETYLANKNAVDLRTLIYADQITELSKEQRLQMVNDPTRRVFESYYAKYALENIANNPEILNRYYEFSVQQTQYIKDNFCTEKIIQQFDAAVAGKDFTFDSQLGGFYQRIKLIIDTLEISGNQETQKNVKDKLFAIYINRYLNLALKNDPEVSKKLPENHWDKIYDFFKAPGKGRIEMKIADLFRQTDSYAVGILRNFDTAPADLRLNHPYTIEYENDYHGKLSAGKSTRCPDRLEIQDPIHEGAYAPNSYVGELFNGGVGTYVNGPSGTILIEHGAIRACKEIHQHRTAEEINNFLELQGLLFIYIDGGHSMYEISRALKTDVIRTKLVETFDDKEEFQTVGDNMFTNPDALEKAAKNTAIFNRSLLTKDAVHQAIQLRPIY